MNLMGLCRFAERRRRVRGARGSSWFFRVKAITSMGVGPSLDLIRVRMCFDTSLQFAVRIRSTTETTS